MNQNRTKGRLLSLGSDYRSHRLKSVLESVEGFGASIVAIGVARAWLSLQTGIVAAFDTAPFPDHDLAWLRSAAIVVASAALSLVRLGPRFASVRRVLCCTLGLLGALLYCAGLYLVPADTVGSVAVAIALAVLFCWMLRIWCEDNCSSDLRTLLIRLCLSFVVQYLFYSVVYLVPSPVQRLVAILSPLLVMGCLAVAPQRTQTPLTSCFIFSNTSDNKNKDTGGSLPLVNVATLGIVIAACCASHGLLFGFSETVTGVWLLGSLVIAGIVLGAATALSGTSLFKGFVCISLATQCASVVLTLAFPGNADWISLSKSMSYAVSMVLTFSIACYLGASHPAPRAGTCAAKWVALYFAAFYCASFLEQTLRPDAFVPLVVVLLCLVVSAVLMLGNDWSELMPSQTLPEEAQNNEPTIELDHTSWCHDVALRAGLTGRETDVLDLLLDNVSVKEIAVQSGVSINTVRSQVQAVYRKLDVHSRDDLVELFEREAQTCRPQDEPMTGRPSSR